MYMHVRATGNFIYAADYGTDAYNAFDLLDIVVHELLHGLAFSSLIPSSTEVHPFRVPDKLTVYDSFLYTPDAAIADLSRSVDQPAREIGAKDVVFRISPHRNVTVHEVARNERPSLIHLGMAYDDGEDSLMTPFAAHHAKVMRRLRFEAWRTAPLGEATLAVLERLGYTRNMDARRDHSQLGFLDEMAAAVDGEDEFSIIIY